MILRVGDVCPGCRWILTLRDFALGRCGNCLGAVPLDRGAAREWDELVTPGPVDQEGEP